MYAIRWAAISLVVIGFVALTGCGGRGNPQLRGPLPGQNSALEPERVDLAQALSEIAAAVAPSGVDSALFNILKAELARVVAQAPSGALAVAPPSGPVNQISDLDIQLAGAALRFSWSYRNAGDYDQSGEVNAGDLAPLALHFGETSSAPDWEHASLADGDGNGEVNISDITTIGRHYLSQIAAYGIYSGQDGQSGWTLIEQAPLALADRSAARLSFAYDVAVADAQHYYVAPLTSLGAAGGESNHAERPGNWYSAGGDARHSGRSIYNGPASGELRWRQDCDNSA